LLVEEAEDGQKAVNVLLSRDETYADIAPVRLNSNGVNAFVSIMRGCNNMCSFCVVPFTRGRERSRNPGSVLAECRDLFEKGYREVTLLGQNVDSYHWHSGVDGEKAVGFAGLLRKLRDFTQTQTAVFNLPSEGYNGEVLYTIARYENICNYIHLPVQSGSTRVLQRMNRTYTREWYLSKIRRIRELIPDCGITSDIIAGFCAETEEDHQATLTLMRESCFDMSYMYFYSERPGTLAARRYPDDIPEPEKKRRLDEIVKLQNKISQESNRKDLGTISKVLIEGDSKKSDRSWMGRNDQNKVVVFPKSGNALQKGDYALVKIEECTGATLIGHSI
jgi:tRNA-2-methylthio-N6-dimethylallyladenosine synthase